jgi:hypothetical protein
MQQIVYRNSIHASSWSMFVIGHLLEPFSDGSPPTTCRDDRRIQSFPTFSIGNLSWLYAFKFGSPLTTRGDNGTETLLGPPHNLQICSTKKHAFSETLPLFFQHFVQSGFDLLKQFQGELIALGTRTFPIGLGGGKARTVQPENLRLLQAFEIMTLQIDGLQ